MRSYRAVEGYFLVGFGFFLFVPAARAEGLVGFVFLAVALVCAGWVSLKRSRLRKQSSGKQPAPAAVAKLHLGLVGVWGGAELLSLALHPTASAVLISSELALGGLLLLALFELRARRPTWYYLPLLVGLVGGATGLIQSFSSALTLKYPSQGGWIRQIVMLGLYGLLWLLLLQQKRSAPSAPRRG